MIIQFILVVSLIQQNYGYSPILQKTVDFIKIIKPKSITAHLCYSKKYQTQLWKNLENQHVSLNLNLTKITENHLFVIDLQCKDSMEILQNAEKLQLFKISVKWIFINYENNLNFYFRIDSQVFLINLDEIKTVYKYSENSNFFLEEKISNFGYFSVFKRRDLFGNSINVSIVVTNKDTLNHLEDYRDTHIDAITKLNYILSNILLDYLNASRDFKIQPSWGYRNSTGMYSGMAGDLQQGLAELGGTPMFFTIDRIDIVDYIAATTPTYMKFIFRAPPLSYVTNVFTLPFESSVWHYCFVMVFIVIIVIYVIVKWEWKDAKFREQTIRENSEALEANILDVIMLEIGAITQQGTKGEPQSNAGRIVTIFTFVTLMFLYTSYSANIVALLQSTTESITSLEDLLNSRIKLGVEDIVYARYYFENAKEPIRKAIYQQKIAPKNQKANFLKAEEGIKRVQDGFFGFHIELNTGYKLISKMFHEGEKCGLKEIEYVNFIEPWIATRKNSAYKELMKVGLKKMHEFGIQNREVRKVYTRKPQCHGRGNNFGSVGLIDCYSAFLLFGIGIGLSVVLFLGELIVKTYLLNRIKDIWQGSINKLQL